jgi:hypothetical protein
MHPFFVQALEALQPLILAGLTYLAATLALAIRNKVKNAYLQETLVRLNDTAFDVVMEFEQTMVNEYREAAKDGKLDAEEVAEIKAHALGKLKNHFGPKGLDELRKILGFDSQKKFDEFLSGKLESQLRQMKDAAVEMFGEVVTSSPDEEKKEQSE